MSSRVDTVARGSVGGSPASRTSPEALQENVENIKAWERALLHERSTGERIGDWIAARAATGGVMALHVVWFAAWIAANTGLIPGVAPFDPFPFTFLTMVVSLEAIFLALFVLASQNRLTRQSDKRAHLDLQIDLLSEREMTAVLQLLQDIARHLGVRTSVTADQLRDLAKKTDVNSLAERMDELVEAQSADSEPAEKQTETNSRRPVR